MDYRKIYNSEPHRDGHAFTARPNWLSPVRHSVERGLIQINWQSYSIFVSGRLDNKGYYYVP